MQHKRHDDHHHYQQQAATPPKPSHDRLINSPTAPKVISSMGPRGKRSMPSTEALVSPPMKQAGPTFSITELLLVDESQGSQGGQLIILLGSVLVSHQMHSNTNDFVWIFQKNSAWQRVVAKWLLFATYGPIQFPSLIPPHSIMQLVNQCPGNRLFDLCQPIQPPSNHPTTNSRFLSLA